MFQVFGFDILLDKDRKAWVLEINDHPSFNIMFSKDFMGGNKEEEHLSMVDLHVKSQVMTDALHLVMLKKSQLSEIEDTFRSYTRILPCDDEDHNEVGETMH